MVVATSKHGGATDIQTLFGILSPRRAKIFVYGFLFAFVACTAYLAFNPSPSSSPWFGRFFSPSDTSSRPDFSSVFSYFFPSPTPPPAALDESPPAERDRNVADGVVVSGARVFNFTASLSRRNDTTPVATPKITNATAVSGSGRSNRTHPDIPKNETRPAPESRQNATTKGPVSQTVMMESHHKDGAANGTVSNRVSGTPQPGVSIEAMKKCDLYDGKWVKDDSYPLYREGSCPFIDEQFDCFHNGRLDKDYLKFRWQPNGCNIPRLNAADMLERLRGRRLVFVGDSLNRNMWEALVCVLRNSVKDKSRVFEVSGKQQFRTQGAYSFVFKDYNCSVEFFWSPFLVQEWAVVDRNGTTRETLRLDLFERKSEKFRKADVVVFNTGHWWTHEKTSLGKNYYQEGNHVHSQLNVDEAFRRALVTLTKWVDVNVDPQKTLVFLRGYSASHFSGGQWNSGGACDNETIPIDNEKYLTEYPAKMKLLETVLNEAKTPISYLNITRLTDYRKDGHPSIYRKRKYSDEERRAPLRYQDCSHWCLPGVPDSWNELLYAELLIKLHKVDE